MAVRLVVGRAPDLWADRRCQCPTDKKLMGVKIQASVALARAVTAVNQLDSDFAFGLPWATPFLPRANSASMAGGVITEERKICSLSPLAIEACSV